MDMEGVNRIYDQLWQIRGLGFPKLIFTILDAPELNMDVMKHSTMAKFIEASSYLALRDFGPLIESLEDSGHWISTEDCGCFTFEFERMWILGESYFQTRQFEKATQTLLQAAQPEIIEMRDSHPARPLPSAQEALGRWNRLFPAKSPCRNKCRGMGWNCLLSLQK